jgi:transposase
MGRPRDPIFRGSEAAPRRSGGNSPATSRGRPRGPISGGMATAAVPGCPGCAALEERVRALEGALEESRRAGKRQAAPFSKGEPKTDPKRPGRKPGKDYGRTARRAIPSEVDEILDAPLPGCCPRCRGRVVEDRVETQYQTEIPPVEPQVLRFDVHVGHCEACGQRVQGRHPQQTSDALGAAASQLGPRVVAFSAWLHQVLGLPYGKASALLEEAFGIEVSSGGLVQAHARLARCGEPAYAGLIEEVRASPAVYPDETSARMNGQRWWLWVFATALATVYVQRPSRGFDVVEEILGKDFSGLVGHDGWAPYDKLTEAAHQQCLNHLITRAKEMLETATRGAVRFPRKVKQILQDALRLRDRHEDGALTEHGFRIARGQIEKRMARVLAMHVTHEGNRRFQKHLEKHAHELFTFLYKDVEATNWRAEQAIRPSTRFRKTSGGHRSPRGARTRDVLLTLFQTVRQRGLDPLPLLAGMLQSQGRDVLIPAAAGS